MMDVDTFFPRGSRQCRGALEFDVDDFCRKVRVNVVVSLLLLSLSVVGCLRKVRNPGRMKSMYRFGVLRKLEPN